MGYQKLKDLQRKSPLTRPRLGFSENWRPARGAKGPSSPKIFNNEVKKLIIMPNLRKLKEFELFNIYSLDIVCKYVVLGVILIAQSR